MYMYNWRMHALAYIYMCVHVQTKLYLQSNPGSVVSGSKAYFTMLCVVLLSLRVLWYIVRHNNRLGLSTRYVAGFTK